MWAPFRDPRMLANPKACCVSLIGRLKPGVSRASDESELNLRSRRGFYWGRRRF
jgi:hypothetical protein